VQPIEPEVPADPAAISLFGDAFAEQKAAREAQEPRRSTPPPAQQEVNRDLDAPTERLPIYEAVLSQWFEEGDGEKRTSASERGRPSEDRSTPPPARRPSPAPSVAPQAVTTNGVSGNGVNGTNGVHAEQPAPQPQHHHLQPEPEPEPEPAPEPAPVAAEEPAHSAWQSPGDEGWQAAQKLSKKAPEVVTSAGLPKRVPKAQLIPGSAPSRPGSGSQAQRSPALPPRSADAVRGRMSSFQQGIRRGRHSMVDAYAGDQDSVDSRQDEEQE
jgi:hypothetical protein